MTRRFPLLSPRAMSAFLASTLLILAGALPGTASAADAKAKEADPALARAVEKAEVVCKRVRETGSRTTKRVCTTKQQRDTRAERAREDLERLAEMRSGQPTGEF